MITPAKYKALCMAIGPQKHVASLLGVTHFTLSRRWNPSARIPREAELAVRQLQQPAGWRPIDTAPRDGTAILVGWVKATSWSKEEVWETAQAWWVDSSRPYWGLMHAGSYAEDNYLDGEPTHWHPLPPEPLTTGKDDWA